MDGLENKDKNAKNHSISGSISGSFVVYYCLVNGTWIQVEYW